MSSLFFRVNTKVVYALSPLLDYLMTSRGGTKHLMHVQINHTCNHQCHHVVYVALQNIDAILRQIVKLLLDIKISILFPLLFTFLPIPKVL
jgi:hypothetical protein